MATITRHLTRSDLPHLLALQDAVLDRLPRPEIFEPYRSDWIRDRIENQGHIIGAFADSELVAFCHVYFPDVDDARCNYGFDLGFSEAERRRVVNLHMFCVHPLFRGNGLARQLNRMALAEIQTGTRRHHHVCASVSPCNPYSLRVLFDVGLQIAGLALKYGGKLRYIMHRNLRRCDDDRPERDRPGALPATEVALDDLNAQKRLLAHGSRGVRLMRLSNGPFGRGRPEEHDYRVVFQELPA